MSDKLSSSLAGSLSSKAAIGAAAAIGSAAIAAAVLYAGRRRDKADMQPPRTSTAPHMPPETD